MLRFPKVASTTERGSSGDVFVIQWLPLLLRHRAALAARLRRDFLAFSAFCVFPPSAQRPTQLYSGENSKSLRAHAARCPLNPKYMR